MNLPDIPLEGFMLPFEVQALWHPAVVHFVITLPIVILLLEVINFILNKKAISAISFLLMALTVFTAVLAYASGLIDAKDAALSDIAKVAVEKHKLLGVYLMLGSGVVLLFKLFAMMAGKGIIKWIYLLSVVVLVLGIFKQGKEGMALVYVHGLNVKAIQVEKKEIIIEPKAEKVSILKITEAPIVSEEKNEENVIIINPKISSEANISKKTVEIKTTEMKEEAKPVSIAN